MEEKVLNIKEIIQILKKRLKIIILIAILTAVAGFYITTKMQSSYIASLKVFVGRDGVEGTYTPEELKTYKENINYYIEVFKTDEFYEEAIKKSGLNRTPGQIASCLTMMPAGESAPLLEIRYVDLDKSASVKVLEALTDLFMEKSSKLIEGTNMERIEAAKVRVQNPNKVKLISVAFIVGLILGIGIVLIWDYLDDTVKSAEELEDILGVSVIGTVPVSEDLK